MDVREAQSEDLNGLLALYKQFNSTPIDKADAGADSIWCQILTDPHHHVVVAQEDSRLVSTCVLVIIPNLTHGGRPYALIENVITDKDYRDRGYATAVLDAAKELALTKNCYKMMLMTGAKSPATLCFYERAGYNRSDKTAFIQWLP